MQSPDRRKQQMSVLRPGGRVLLAVVAGLAPSLLAGPAAADYAAAKALYDQGRRAEAAAAFEAAASQGDALAQFMMGRIYEEGGGGGDAVRAYSWYAIAASSGYYPAVAAREALAPSLTADRLARAQQMAADWRLAHPLRHSAAGASAGASDDAAEAAAPMEPYSVAAVQRLLGALGYRPGPVDGMTGALTRNAIRAFEIDRALPVTGTPSPALYQHLLAVEAARLGRAAGGEESRLPQDDAGLIAGIQAELRRRGFDVASVNGMLDALTRQAIRAYQADAGLGVDGLPSAELLARLQAEAAE
jgi:hypothetical protein